MNVIVSAGGTGGDLFPAIAVVEQLKKRMEREFSASFVGNPSRIESKIVPSLGHCFTPITVTGFKGFAHVSTLALPWRIIHSEIIVNSLINKLNPSGMICGGTYISFPAARAAFRRNIPVMLIESNVVPGKTNRLLASKATRIIVAFEETKEYFPLEVQKNIFVTGNPVRESLALTLPDSVVARLNLGLQTNIFTVFVFGGSLGARAINLAVEAALPHISSMNIQVVWQTGANYVPPKTLPSNVVVRSFFDDMATPYAAADIIVCRAGGSTVAELGNVGKPAILAPLPSAANNEQILNAKAVESEGAAIVVNNNDIAAQLLPLLEELRSNAPRLSAMSSAAKRRARPEAARHAADVFLSMIDADIRNH